MKSIPTTRIVIILVVTLISIWFTYPTFEYYLHLREQPAVTGTRPSVDGPEPPATDVAKHVDWEKRNADFVNWRSANSAYVAWDKISDELRPKAVPLGLDLIGGVDVTLKLDREKAIKNMVSATMESLQRDLDEKDKISAAINPTVNGDAFTLHLTNPADAHTAVATINNRNIKLDHTVTEGELSQGQTITLHLDEAALNRTLSDAMDGALKGVRDRVDALGVTQPRIARQGPDEIRIQVPGEKDPQTLIKNVIQPAQLEFRLVSEDQDNVIDPQTGLARPGAQAPLGTEIVDGQLTENGPNNTVVYKKAQFLLLNKVELTGSHLRSASVYIDFSKLKDAIQVQLELDKEGTKIFGDVTTKYVHHRLAILLDGVVRSAPNLNEPILDGRAVITGGFTQEEATELSQILKAGSLPAPLKIVSNHVVGSSVGADSILSSVRALTIGSIVIALFMIVYYGTSGAIAVVALILNILMVLAIMGLSRATLTLSGIGGILLTVGMAVDSNVLIYERIREEIAGGRSVRQAIAIGYQRAFNVILDSHLTTLLTAMVLLQFTEGSVKGFALAMTFGLIANLYTGLTVTYTLCQLWFEKMGHLTLGRLHIFQHANFDFIGKRFISWSLSNGVFFIALIAVLSTHGFVLGVDFAGGYRAEVTFDQATNEDSIRAALKNVWTDPSVQSVIDQKNDYIIDVQNSALKEGETAADQVSRTQADLEGVLGRTFGADKFHIVSSSSFDAQTAKGFANLAIVVVIIAALAMLIYLWFRFELVFGAAAVVALLHDLSIVLLLSCLWHVPITLDVVAAFMVLMGFSTNDTIVIFDRIRENTRTMYGKSFGELCNLAMNRSLSRTIITSGTVFLAAFVLYWLGGEGLRPFAKVYLLGTIIGTYSSDFIAAPIVYQWDKHTKHRVQQELAAQKKRIEAAKPIRTSNPGGGPAAPLRRPPTSPTPGESR